MSEVYQAGQQQPDHFQAAAQATTTTFPAPRGIHFQPAERRHQQREAAHHVKPK